MNEHIRSIPRPLVKTNQWFIVISVLATWLTNQYWILLVPLISGLMGLLFGYNPIMKIARLFLKKEPSVYIPEDLDQLQFNQMIAIICLGGGLISFLIGWEFLAFLFTGMVALASFIAILGFCIGCFIRFQWKQYKYRKSL